MNNRPFFFVLFFLAVTTSLAFANNSSLLDTRQIENLTGIKGEWDEESTLFKISSPRTNIKVSAAGVKITPALGLMSWVAFKLLNSEVEVMGDMLVFEDQINLIMQEALESGLKVTSLYNHFLWDVPRIMCVHIEGRGNLKTLATGVGKLFEQIHKTSAGSVWRGPPAIINPDKSTLNPYPLEDLFEKRGSKKEGIFKLIWKETTFVAFAGTDGEAVMLGEIATKEDETQNVLKTFLKRNLYILSLHPCMGAESSHMKCVRYMGRGPVLDLAKTLKEALEQTNLPISNPGSIESRKLQ